MVYTIAQEKTPVKRGKYPMGAGVKNKVNLMVWVLGFALTVHSQTPKFAYRPYPILLVHGFNTSVQGTWAWPMEKGEDKTKKQYSTNVTGLQADPHTLGYFHFGPELTAIFSPPSITENPLKKSYVNKSERPIWDPDIIGTSDQNDGLLYPCFRPGDQASDCPNNWELESNPETYANRL